MNGSQKQPIIVLLTSHWISMAGVTLVTLAGVSWVFALPENLRGHVGNPYIGLLLFIAIPIVFFIGLALIPIGIVLGRHRAAAGLGPSLDRRAAWRRAGLFFAIMTAANIVIGSQLTYRAVAHMETNQFCGRSCHVMQPEFTAHRFPPHQQVGCAACHIEPGAAGWVKAKMAGTRQLFEVVTNTFPRPIPSALETDRLASSAETCEQCHSRARVFGPLLRVITSFQDDEANTRTETVLMMHVGGGMLGGIHGAHMGPGVHIRYAAADSKRQTIPWVEYTNTKTGVTQTYIATGTKPESVRSLATFEMECADCHNRVGHSFDLPERAVDHALADGRLPLGLPFLKKTAVSLVKAVYTSRDEAAQKIPAALNAFYQQKYADISAKRSKDIELAGQTLAAIYRDNVFPGLRVTWGTYANNLGHTDAPGCFRCHDDAHAAANKKTITQDCGACHQMLATDESNPAILKTLGLAEAAANLNSH